VNGNETVSLFRRREIELQKYMIGGEMMEGKCAICGLKERLCRGFEDAKAPAFCSTVLYEDVFQEALREYDDEEINRFARAAIVQEKQCYGFDEEGRRYPLKPRMTEIIEFCHKMGYKKIGLAFCGGLHKEAAIVNRILENAGLEVVSVMCKIGNVDKTVIGAREDEKIYPGKHESMCNPISQAMVLNKEKTEFNVLLGLCVGHDSLFLKYSDALCTVFASKDRLMGHNPLAAIYLSDSYYKYLKE